MKEIALQFNFVRFMQIFFFMNVNKAQAVKSIGLW